MPTFFAGNLNVVVEHDIGSVGERVGPPVTIQLPLWRHWSKTLPFLLLLSLFFIQSNRNGRAWWILAPLALATACLLPMLGKTFFDLPVAKTEPLVVAAWLLAISQASLLLLAGTIAQPPYGWFRHIVALFFMILIGWLGAVSFYGVSSGGFAWRVFCYHLCGSLILVLGIGFAGWHARPDIRGKRLASLFAGYLLVSTIVVIFVIALVMFLNINRPFVTFGSFMLRSAIRAAAIYATLLALSLPFLITIFNNKLLHERFASIFEKKGAPADATISN